MGSPGFLDHKDTPIQGLGNVSRYFQINREWHVDSKTNCSPYVAHWYLHFFT